MIFKEYIKKRLQTLAEHFPEVQIRYGFNAISDMHLVELTPSTEYYNNSELDDEWMEISFDVLSLYPNELISFITDDSSISVDNAALIFNERTYSTFNTYKTYALSGIRTQEDKTVFVFHNICDAKSLMSLDMFEFSSISNLSGIPGTIYGNAFQETDKEIYSFAA